jgi:hypothetical protein
MGGHSHGAAPVKEAGSSSTRTQMATIFVTAPGRHRA